MRASTSTEITSAARSANRPVSEPVPVPISSTMSGRTELRRIDQQPDQVQIDQKVLAVPRVGLDADFGEAPLQERQRLMTWIAR